MLNCGDDIAGTAARWQRCAQLIELAEAHGHEPQQLCRAVGISWHSLQNPDATVATDAVERVSLQVATLIGDPHVGLRLAQSSSGAARLDPGLLMMMACSSLEESLQRMERMQTYWSDGARIRLLPLADGVCLRHEHTGAPRPRADSAYLDGDHRPFRAQGVPGLVFATIGDLWACHTKLDRFDRVEPGTVQHLGDTMVEVSRYLATRDLPEPTHEVPGPVPNFAAPSLELLGSTDNADGTRTLQLRLHADTPNLRMFVERGRVKSWSVHSEVAEPRAAVGRAAVHFQGFDPTGETISLTLRGSQPAEIELIASTFAPSPELLQLTASFPDWALPVPLCARSVKLHI